MTLLEELREQGIILEAAGDRLKFRGSAEVLTPALRQRIAEHKAEILACLHHQPAQALEGRISFAHGERELEEALEQIQPAFEQGHLSQGEVERLTYLSIEIARQLDTGLVNVPAATFLGAL